MARNPAKAHFILLKLLGDQLEYLKIITGVVAVIVYVSVRLFAGYTGDIYICLWWELAKSFCGACFLIGNGIITFTKICKRAKQPKGCDAKLKDL